MWYRYTSSEWACGRWFILLGSCVYMGYFKGVFHRRDRALRLHGAIAHDLGLAIVAGLYADGEVLTGEIASSAELDVSRTAYREAIRILAAKGLVTSKPKIGTRVNPRSAWHILDPDVMAWTFEAGPNAKTVDDLFELRIVVEPAAAAMAAERRSEVHARTLRDSLECMKRFTLTSEAGRIADITFHETLLLAADNPYVASLSEAITTAILTTNIYRLRGRISHSDIYPEHAAVCSAICDRDADAARAGMLALISGSRKLMEVPKTDGASGLAAE